MLFVKGLIVGSKAQKKTYVITTRFFVRRKLLKRLLETKEAWKKLSLFSLANGTATLTHHEPAILRYNLRGVASSPRAGSKSGSFPGPDVSPHRIEVESWEGQVES